MLSILYLFPYSFPFTKKKKPKSLGGKPPPLGPAHATITLTVLEFNFSFNDRSCSLLRFPVFLFANLNEFYYFQHQNQLGDNSVYVVDVPRVCQGNVAFKSHHVCFFLAPFRLSMHICEDSGYPLVCYWTAETTSQSSRVVYQIYLFMLRRR